LEAEREEFDLSPHFPAGTLCRRRRRRAQDAGFCGPAGASRDHCELTCLEIGSPRGTGFRKGNEESSVTSDKRLTYTVAVREGRTEIRP
jgi:hypothetical protein